MAPQTESGVEKPTRIIEPASESEIMREQLDYLIEHAEEDQECTCPECDRYKRVRSILLEIFAESRSNKVQPIGPSFPKAA